MPGHYKRKRPLRSGGVQGETKGVSRYIRKELVNNSLFRMSGELETPKNIKNMTFSQRRELMEEQKHSGARNVRVSQGTSRTKIPKSGKIPRNPNRPSSKLFRGIGQLARVGTGIGGALTLFDLLKGKPAF
jgi:hypothetical protein